MKRRTVALALAWTSAVAVLMAVMALYLRPDFMVTLADQLWSCF